MKPSPKLCFMLFYSAGIGLLFVLWLYQGETAGFFPLLFMVVTGLLRWRVPKAKHTVWIDIIVCAIFVLFLGAPVFLFALPLFSAMYLSVYQAVFGMLFVLVDVQPQQILVLVLSLLCGLLLSLWEQDVQKKLVLRDNQAERYYELENAQSDQLAALSQIERLTTVAERTRIAREIHDNAGHEIVAAYISLQTARELMGNVDPEVLELYDAALLRLNSGADKIRQAVHNLSDASFIGVESLAETCRGFPVCPVEFRAWGDSSIIPVYVWNMLEAALNESLTNVARHANATHVTVSLDTTPHIVRLCVENNGAAKTGISRPMGSGLRNLRHRAAAIGGSLAVDAGEAFRVICVIPIKKTGETP